MKISTIDNKQVYYYDIPENPVVEMLSRNKLYGQVLYNLIDRLLKPGSIVLDIGANFGTFSLAAATKGHSVLSVETDQNMTDCLHKTFENNNNISILTTIPTGFKERISCINFFNKHSLLQDIESCKDILISQNPITLISIDTTILQQQNIKTENIFETLESLGYKSFFYNAPNFYLNINPTGVFPFCEMVAIGLSHSTIIANLGSMTFGCYLSNELTEDLIKRNLSNTKPECLDYLKSLKI